MEDKILEVAKSAAKEAGKQVMPLFGRASVVRAKESPTDIVSEADLVAENIIYSTLTQAFPDFNYLSEEREFIDKGSAYTWIIDPIDGTIQFVSGLDSWCIAIGLLKKGESLVGVVNMPIKDWLFYARQGKGAFLNGNKIKVSGQKEYDKAMVGFDVGHRGFRREDLLKNIAPQIDNVRYMPSFASAVAGEVFVARGILDAYIHHRCFVWDICAGAVIVKEAGGEVTDHQGKPLDFSKKENFFVLVSNGLLHDQILGALEK